MHNVHTNTHGHTYVQMKCNNLFGKAMRDVGARSGAGTGWDDEWKEY